MRQPASSMKSLFAAIKSLHFDRSCCILPAMPQVPRSSRYLEVAINLGLAVFMVMIFFGAVELLGYSFGVMKNHDRLFPLDNRYGWIMWEPSSGFTPNLTDAEVVLLGD